MIFLCNIGRFSWTTIAGYNLPYLFRIINGVRLKYASTRMAEAQLFSGYLNKLHPDIYTWLNVKSDFITHSEASVLNYINQNYFKCVYGKELFFAEKDYIVRLKDIRKFYKFLKVCYEKILCNDASMHKDKCGFIRINSSESIPYCSKGSQKYVPLLYFEGETESIVHRTVQLKNWNLAYLKFCFKIHGIKEELYENDSCTAVIPLADLKNLYPPETVFEYFWPVKLANFYIITNQSTHANQRDSWFILLSGVIFDENTTSFTLPSSTPIIPESTEEMMNPMVCIIY